MQLTKTVVPWKNFCNTLFKCINYNLHEEMFCFNVPFKRYNKVEKKLCRYHENWNFICYLLSHITSFSRDITNLKNCVRYPGHLQETFIMWLCTRSIFLCTSLCDSIKCKQSFWWIIKLCSFLIESINMINKINNTVLLRILPFLLFSYFRWSLDTTLCDKVCQWLSTGRWFSPNTLVSSSNKTDHMI